MPTLLAEYLGARKAIHSAIVTLVRSLDTKALVLPRRVFTDNEENWPGELRSPLDIDDNGNQRIHAIQIALAGAKQDNRPETPPGLMLPILPIEFGFYRLYEIGTNDDNSEAKLDAEIATVQMAIQKAERFEGCSFDGLSVPRYALTRPLSGTGRIHYGLGMMEIEMQGVQLR